MVRHDIGGNPTADHNGGYGRASTMDDSHSK
jgi:hypothetical protein